MMKVFNAFQLVVGFALTPFAISWLHEQTFPGASIAFWVSFPVYFVMFVMMVLCVVDAI